MKRLSTIIMALALVLGMSQCKKQETPATGNITPSNPGAMVLQHQLACELFHVIGT